MIENNICLLTDSYKVTHHYFYPKGTEKIYSYLESRVGAEFNKTIFYGLQYIIKKYLEGSVVTQEKIDEADKLISAHIGEGIFNKDGWEYILDEYDGKLPIEIKAVAEGTPVDVSNVLMTVENTDRKSYWLVNYLESLLRKSGNYQIFIWMLQVLKRIIWTSCFMISDIGEQHQQNHQCFADLLIFLAFQVPTLFLH